ncbi:pyruvate dehydrogenase E1 component alpha subunit [Actinomadura hallensis]|jgi:pyruvate dehydrogenase E1 component alpha subunit|uniref:Pyruvate dehydrogenase E1 component subunit alpha n=1 Tax=Actinomadura hallensis TaxID=337895 RepID=A0A543ICF3_9ACTN|nr:pyruvate dehydrogenase (acetyl-transferring) E1 component subunit alpha [Actinomadura hallensis]TQM68264.1 pyruvate dehydrogenase E1 component alpha subunit [Actinomadura hallensis]HLV72246.1 pyruvate dehydrogenase (acetyl-transferring) E1 component subunit alpha [Vulgatibacteraceae bacterium]
MAATAKQADRAAPARNRRTSGSSRSRKSASSPETAASPDAPLPPPDGETLVGYYRQMLLIRRFEERAARAYTEAKIGGYCHLNLGEEATIVGLMAALRPTDYLFTNYREHGYAIAKGIGADRVMAELYGRSTGVSKGWGGSMHLFDTETRLLGGYGIVGGQLPLATGAALAVSYKGGDEVVMCQMGDGTAAIGAFHESLNIASLWNLPVVFVIINNGLGMGTTVEKSSAEPELYRRGAAYRMASSRVDGTDVVAVRDAAAAAVERARGESKPYLLETTSPRLKGHSVVDPARYRSKEEREALKAADPLAKMALELEEAGVLSPDERDRLDAEVKAEVDAAADFADRSPEPDVSTLFDYTYATPVAGEFRRMPADPVFRS